MSDYKSRLKTYGHGGRSSSRRRQPRREKIPPPAPIPCTVRNLSEDRLMQYDEEKRILVLVPGQFYRFPAKSKAQAAIWRTEQAGLGRHENFKIEDL